MEMAIEATPPQDLPDADCRTLCLRYAQLERKLGEVRRAVCACVCLCVCARASVCSSNTLNCHVCVRVRVLVIVCVLHIRPTVMCVCACLCVFLRYARRKCKLGGPKLVQRACLHLCTLRLLHKIHSAEVQAWRGVMGFLCVCLCMCMCVRVCACVYVCLRVHVFA